MTKVDKVPLNRISQGDIYKDIDYIEYAEVNSGIVEVSKITFPFVVVLSQDCDLQQDYDFRFGEPAKSTQDKYIMSVIVAPLYNIEHFYEGTHLSEINLKMEPFERNPKKTKNKNLLQNEIPRYHYLKFPDDIPIVTSVIDFKQYFSVNTTYLLSVKSSHFVCKLSFLYREDVSQRFSSFLARIGLPD